MKRLFFISLTVALFISCSQNKKVSQRQAIKVWSDSIASLMEKRKIPGLSVTVMVDGEKVWSEGFGHTDIEQDVHVNPSKSKFRIGSISKALTAAGLARLYEQKKIIL